MPTPKKSWADMADEADAEEAALPEPVSVSRHGVKIKKHAPSKPTYVPPHLRDKSKTSVETK